MSAPRLRTQFQRQGRGGADFIGWSLWLLLFCGICQAGLADGAAREYEVKAQCLYHFAKYVDWPTNGFPNEGAPIYIGVIGNDQFAETLKAAVIGKNVNGHPLAIQVVERGGDASKCQILFVSYTENKRLDRILAPINSSPVLTVGEGNTFGQGGGIISFVIRNQRIRFDIDLTAAKRSGLKISSKLLSLADTVRGKPN
ncbi:MAG TPA: YfiR family protein [Verrucomicrobiae bacterium]|nr:YfiR family protein [Verrucomicrobiae bacterium]